MTDPHAGVMNLFSWFRRRITPTERPEPPDHVRWLPAADNPFGVDVLDCSTFAQSMVATTSSAEVAARFGQLRLSSGEHCRGREPADAVVTECHLQYPSERNQDGPIFKAEQMEDKWDLYLFEEHLYFTRSWTGDLVYKARIVFEDSRAVVTEIRARHEPARSVDPVGAVDFLVKSHIYDLIAPHPLPGTDGLSLTDLAGWSFACYGRRGLFATTSDVRHLTVVRQGDGGCRLMLPGSR